MSTETAKIIVYAIATIALIVWVCSFEFLRHTTLRRRSLIADAADRFELDEVRPAGMISGEAELKGTPAALSAKLASCLAKEGLGVLGPVRLTEVADNRVAFDSGGLPFAGSKQGYRVKGEIAFRPGKSGNTEAAYLVETPSTKGLMIAAWTIQTISLIALIALVWLMQAYVVDNPNPGIRGQSMQTIQIVHLLWLPFLFAGLARSQWRMAQTRLQALISNLPYV